MNVPIKKIEIIIEKDKKEVLFEELQKLGAVEIITDQKLSEKEDNSNILKKYAELRFVKKFLDQFKEKKNLLETVLKEKETFKLSDLNELMKSSKINQIISDCASTEERLNSFNLKKEKLEKEIEILKKFEGLSIASLIELKYHDYFIGYLKKEKIEFFLNEMKGLSSCFEYTESGYFILIYNKKDSNIFQNLLQKYEAREEKPFWNKFPLEELKNREKEFKNIILDIEILIKKTEKMANSLFEIEALIDFYDWEKQKSDLIKQGEETKGYYLVKAWVIEEALPKIKEILNNISAKYLLSEVSVSDSDSPPVFLKSEGLSGNFVAVTNIYGLPKSNELDPTPHLAIFFVLFFGLALSDAGYGALLIILSIILKRFLKEKNYVRFFNLFILGGISTIIAGILTGTFFGTEYFSEYRILDPVKSPITTLIFLMALGALQIFVGIIIGMVQSLKQGDLNQAMGDKAGSILFFIGIFLYFLTNIPLFAIIGVASLFLLNIIFSSKKGIFGKIISGFGGLYGIVGYFSDILSYSRLLALGLATGIIAMVINIIALLSKDMIPIPIVNWIVMIMVLVVGHTANLLINALGSFIHSARLQFVEFFSKFMEGGGRSFKPLIKKGNFINIIN